ncbi:putative aldehyde dehydrogenase [Dactylonectria macrodidyma]|uniref:aldehyde dehydrogenase (NAD(+)) n=1 Tax=Dactylonectria macrodidyma TaxID=307937 RepID=A0A9P9ILZ9_9HYPO|nr:putative aldehyde dehydrogenase [Dactylonectria macrodidyma]
MSLFNQIKLPNGSIYHQPLGLFINNEMRPSISGKTFPVVKLSSEEIIAHVYEAESVDVDAAVTAARLAFRSEWRTISPERRARLLSKVADLMEENLELLAHLETLNNGKAIQLARGDVAHCVSVYKYYSGWADKVEGRVVDIDNQQFSYTTKEPFGVCGQIIPWNSPLVSMAWKLGPALAAGNTVVLKTAEQTPLSALVVARYFNDAGFPPGVLNVIAGLGHVAGKALAEQKDVNKIAFTGSTATGRAIMEAAAKSNLKPITLELGGKGPNIVFDDANFEAALEWTSFGIFYNSGQVCAAGSRIYVQSRIYKRFLQALKDKAAAIVVGNPFNPNTFQGPQTSQAQFDRVMEYIRDGINAGAKIETGGSRWGQKGYFVEPTIFSGASPSMKIMNEEIFGPVAVISEFHTEDEAIEAANATDHGLASGIHTQNLDRAIRVSRALEAGTVWINQYNAIHHQLPFGGKKQSGIGKELGEAALASYTTIKSVSIRLN